jgi:hypothetical protein
MRRGKNLEVGSRFGRLTVLRETVFPPTPAQVAASHIGNRAAVCRCDCGGEKTVEVSKLRRGQTQSCGCFRRERAATEFRTHGFKEHPYYSRWYQIVARCTRPSHPRYADYGGRGISVHPAWRSDPGAFVAYLDAELGPCPPGHSIDRIDNDGDYVPGNLRWTDSHTQRVNQRAKGPNRPKPS